MCNDNYNVCNLNDVSTDLQRLFSADINNKKFIDNNYERGYINYFQNLTIRLTIY